MISRLDNEAQRLGFPRQSLIKIWIAEKLQGVQRYCFFSPGTSIRSSYL
jgi:hypothetical protein